MGAIPSDPEKLSNLVVLGRVSGLFGIKGWVKIYSYTEPMDNILSYSDCYIKLKDVWQNISFTQGQRQGKGLIAQIKGCDNRDLAACYVGADIAVPGSSLPKLKKGDYYWHELEGLQVITEQGVVLGKVDHLLDTGANDVLVVKPLQNSDKSNDGKNELRLIPYILNHYILDVNLDLGQIIVDWNPED